MRLFATVWLAFVLLLAGPAPMHGESLTIDEWVLSTGIRKLSSGESDFRHSTVVQNPFQATHFASVGSSTAASAFDFAWADQVGTFLIEASHEAEDVGGSGLFSLSSGGFLVSALSDVPIAIEASYTYNTPATYFDVLLLISVSREDPYEALFIGSRHGGPMAGHPPAGTLTIDGDVSLPAGDTYEIEYTMRIYSFGGDTGILGTGSGFVDFQITPEPSTLALLAMLILIVPRRRHRYARV